jgi:antitoxin ParD1/3/4
MDIDMATTSLSLGGHWEEFIQGEIKSGRYSSASEVVRAALRELEDRGRRLEVLRAHLAEGAGQAARHDFIEDFDVQDVIARAKARA